MKKLLKTSLIALAAVAALTLSACGSKDSAKKAFISDYVSMSQTNDNVQELSLDLTKFKATGKNAEDVNKLEGAKADFKVSTDENNKTASLTGTMSALDQKYNFNFLMSSKGMYIDSKDIKTLYNDNKSLISKSDASTVKVYDAMISALDKPYLLVDAQTIDAGMKSSDESWEDTISSMFKTSGNKTSVKELTEALKDVPDSKFSKNGSKISFDVPMERSFFKAFISKIAADKAGITQAQIDQMLKSISSEDLKNLSAKVTLDSKAHEVLVNFGGKLTGADNDTADFKMTLTAKSSSSNATISVPSDNQSQTIRDVTMALFSSMSSGDAE
ncbi:MAG: hypothetical protein LBV19_10320 [Streptococcaceae bacterium]|jgi:hypothetical protein|nr:hypothetical protein [Streptococcaceae bacterium]